MRFHLEMKIQDNIEAGMSPSQARRAAYLQFGNRTLAREDSRELWGFGWLDRLGQDLRFGFRMLAKSPGFTAVAVLSLALGIGGTSTIFSVISPILLRKPPFVKDPDRVVLISIREPKLESGRDDASSWDSFYWPKASTFLAWREHNRVFEQMARWSGTSMTPNFFRLLGVEPILGRGFRPEDPTVDTAGNVRFPIVISHRFWQRRFSGDPNVVGQTLRDDKQRVMEVIGVMPPDFWIKPYSYERDYWFPRDFSSAATIPNWQLPFARLKPGVSIEQARADLEAIARPLEHPETAPDTGWMVEVQTLHESINTMGNYARPLYLLLGAVGFILLIGCGNVASLLLSRSAARYKEIATRAALGAGRRRLIRQLLTESMLLAVLGGLLGVLLTFVGIKLFIFLAPNFYPPSHEIRIDPTVLGFALGISMLTAILFGLMPALWASRLDLNASLKEGARRSAAPPRHRASSVLVVSEVALALVLLIGAGLMINTFVRLQTEDLGYKPEGLLEAWIQLEGPKYSKRTDGDTTTVSPEGSIFWQQLLKRIEALPGVTSAGTSRIVAPRPSVPFRIIGRSDVTMGERPLVGYNEIGGDYFKTMEIPLLKGRVFNERDTQGSLAVAIISETLARKHFPDEDPLGKVLQVDFQAQGSGRSRLTPQDPAANDRRIIQDKPREIVGVVGSTTDKHRNFDRFSVINVPYSQHPRVYPNPHAHTHRNQSLFVRTASDPAGLATAVREAVADLDKNLLSSTEIETHQAERSSQFDTERFWVRLLGLFAGLAVFLAAVGLYGVISYSVTRRTHEFGLRIALGAHRTSLPMLVLRQGFFLSLIGVAIGIAAALGLTRLLAAQLHGITPTDPATFTAVSLVLIAVTMLASYIPARRATKVDPMVALRHE